MGFLLSILLTAIFFVVSQTPVSAATTADEIFELLDVDGNGSVDPQEYSNKKVMILVLRDLNRDNHLSFDEVRLSETSFREIDKNGDSLINGIEFIESDMADFDKIDSNGDRLMSKQELESWIDIHQ